MKNCKQCGVFIDEVNFITKILIEWSEGSQRLKPRIFFRYLSLWDAYEIKKWWGTVQANSIHDRVPIFESN